MKNIHILPTDKARLYIHQGKLYDNKKTMHIPDGKQIPHHIYITSDEKPKSEDWCLSKLNEVVRFGKKFTSSLYKKIILTTDQDLIKDGVQSINDEFLEWFVKNPSCESIEVEIKPMFPMYSTFIESIDNPPFYGNLKRKIIIPQEEPKQKKDLAYWKANAEEDYIKVPISVLRYITELEKRMYSEEEVKELCKKSRDEGYDENTLEGIGANEKIVPFGEWFEQFKKK
jgi:hypothetical protein